MSILSSVLQVMPSTWDSTSLPKGKNYALITLEEYSNEYDDVRSFLINEDCLLEIEKIKRVQHPFAYGRFLLRKEQLKLRSGSTTESNRIMIKLADKNDVNIALEFNLDERRISTSDYSFTIIIIAQCLKRSYSSIERDSEIYPEYVVYLKE